MLVADAARVPLLRSAPRSAGLQTLSGFGDALCERFVTEARAAGPARRVCASRLTLAKPAKQPRGGRGENRPLEESPDTKGQGGRDTDPGKPAGKCHRNKPPKRRAAREPGAGKGEMVR